MISEDGSRTVEAADMLFQGLGTGRSKGYHSLLVSLALDPHQAAQDI
jgi:hypothetical protein